jgi:hypothetical protein
MTDRLGALPASRDTGSPLQPIVMTGRLIAPDEKRAAVGGHRDAAHLDEGWRLRLGVPLLGDAPVVMQPIFMKGTD